MHKKNSSDLTDDSDIYSLYLETSETNVPSKFREAFKKA